MVIGEFGASSFDSYEGIRIVIPGFIVTACTAKCYSVIAVDGGPPLAEDAISTVVASIAIGLLLYYFDFPAKTAAYNQGLPTDELEKMFPGTARSPLLTAYYAILNDGMSPIVRNRSLYLGSMYRIGLESLVALTASWALVMAFTMRDYGKPVFHDYQTWRMVAAFVLILLIPLSYRLSLGYENKTSQRVGGGRNKFSDNIVRDLSNWHISVFILGLLIMIYGSYDLRIKGEPKNWVASHEILGQVGYLICFGYWLVTYIRGMQADNGRRIPHSSFFSGVLLLLPAIVVLLFYRSHENSVLPTFQNLLIWVAVATMGTLSIVIRGHERKLHGAYSSQRQWLLGHRQMFIDQIQSGVPGAVPQLPQPSNSNSSAAPAANFAPVNSPVFLKSLSRNRKPRVAGARRRP